MSNATADRTVRYFVKGAGVFETSERGEGRGREVLNGDGRWLPVGHPNLFTVTHNGRAIGGVRAKVTVTDHVCGAKCTHATGPICDCCCGGKNHGSGVAVRVG